VKSIKTAFVWLTVLVLAFAPLLPAAGAMLGSDAATEHHGAHAAMDHTQNSAVAGDNGMAFGNDCIRHGACDGQCCNACAQCVAMSLNVLGDSPPHHSVQTAVVPRLHAHLTVALPNRPPKNSL
jgi:hypothetical protein